MQPEIPLESDHSPVTAEEGSSPRVAVAHRRIGIVVKLSDESAFVVKWTSNHYFRTGDNVVLVHVFPNGGSLDASVPLDEPGPELKKLDTVAQPLVDANIPFKVHIVKDHDVKVRLCLEVKRLRLSAVIMGNRDFGAVTGGSDGRLWSLIDYCVHHSVCPVIVVKNADEKEGGAEPVVSIASAERVDEPECKADDETENKPPPPVTRDSERSQIVLFGLETMNVGEGNKIIEFGSIVVSSLSLKKLYSYTTLVKPKDFVEDTFISRSNGLTGDLISKAPMFSEIVNIIFNTLDGRIWAGHNILHYDWPIIKKEFEFYSKKVPAPSSTFDSLHVLRKEFKDRTSNMKMSTLADHFGLGVQPHRSLGDVIINFDIVKSCAAVWFLSLNTTKWVSTSTSTSTSPVAARTPRRAIRSASKNTLKAHPPLENDEEMVLEYLSKPECRDQKDGVKVESIAKHLKREVVDVEVMLEVLKCFGRVHRVERGLYKLVKIQNDS